jgi:hypothetical protein
VAICKSRAAYDEGHCALHAEQERIDNPFPDGRFQPPLWHCSLLAVVVIFAVLPYIENIARRRHIAFPVEADFAEHGVELVAVQGFDRLFSALSL